MPETQTSDRSIEGVTGMTTGADPRARPRHGVADRRTQTATERDIVLLNTTAAVVVAARAAIAHRIMGMKAER